ncbi:DUF4861 domain-containing protein [Pontibacter pamirensis]|uniref:DUF4861 domain-containing protein n=1 Tax=Pontibacter pamirensis TaxID=2562824 RepID=UPI0013896813|nr:DUF4861 domain-containing protein [Pontibacter pamirensis]
MSKRITLLACLLGCLTSCQSEKDSGGQEVTLTNTSSVNLVEKAISIKRGELTGAPDGELYPLVLSQRGDTIPAQLDDLDGDNKWDELFFVKDLPANGEETVHLKWIDTPVNFEKRTSVRFGVRSSVEGKVQPATSDTFYAHELPGVMGYQPYQTDGPSWENDKVGFRHYLDGRNSKDVFGKKVSYMSPDSVGINQEGVTEDNYHVMEAWGRDILSVGNSVGIGGIALMIGDTLARLGVTQADSLNNVDSTFFQILSEGPARSVINYQYHNWKPLNRNYEVEETTSIWPGMYAYKNSARFSHLQGDETLLIGLVNSETQQPLTEIATDDKYVILLTHDKQSYNKEWWLGLALILPKEAYRGYMKAPETGSLSKSYLAKLKVEKDKPVEYYAVAGWELSDEGFRNPAYFQEYVRSLAKKLSAEVKITVEE